MYNYAISNETFETDDGGTLFQKNMVYPIKFLDPNNERHDRNRVLINERTTTIFDNRFTFILNQPRPIFYDRSSLIKTMVTHPYSIFCPTKEEIKAFYNIAIDNLNPDIKKILSIEYTINKMVEQTWQNFKEKTTFLIFFDNKWEYHFCNNTIELILELNEYKVIRMRDIEKEMH